MGWLSFKSRPNLDFIGYRLWTFGFSGFMVMCVILAALFKGLPLGIDFKGGLVMEVNAPNGLSLEVVRTKMVDVFDSSVSVQTFGTANDFLIRLSSTLSAAEQKEVQEKIRNTFGADLVIRRLESVGPKVSQELYQKGLLAVTLALLAMLIYIWFRFEWRFGLAAFLAIAHDCIAVLGLYALFRLEFTEAAIVAILITASYSINDTVVVFDRVRENKGRYGRMPFVDLLNLSVNETLSRTLLTSLTTLGALCVLYFFGGPVISAFSLPILIGLVFGTYSSICLAAPLLSLWTAPSDAGATLVNENKKKL